MNTSVRHRGMRACVIAIVLAVGACSPGGPATRKDLCSAYSDYQTELYRPHILSNSGIFRSLRHLGDVASRYETQSAIQQAGPRLKQMGKAHSFSPGEAALVAAPIYMECQNG
jgi:hypothetical protein